MFYNHLRKVRENKVGAELKTELEKMTSWIDEDPKLFTADILYNLLLSYRDIQVSTEERWHVNSYTKCVRVFVFVCVCVITQATVCKMT